MDQIGEKRRSRQPDEDSALVRRDRCQRDAVISHAEHVVAHAVRRDRKFLKNPAGVVRASGFDAEVLEGSVGGDDLEEHQATGLHPEPLLHRHAVHGLGVVQGDQIPLADPNMRPGPPDLQHLRPDAGEQAGDRQHGERRDAARPSTFAGSRRYAQPLFLEEFGSPLVIGNSLVGGAVLQGEVRGFLVNGDKLGLVFEDHLGDLVGQGLFHGFVADDDVGHTAHGGVVTDTGVDALGDDGLVIHRAVFGAHGRNQVFMGDQDHLDAG